MGDRGHRRTRGPTTNNTHLLFLPFGVRLWHAAWGRVGGWVGGRHLWRLVEVREVGGIDDTKREENRWGVTPSIRRRFVVMASPAPVRVYTPRRPWRVATLFQEA